MPRTSARSIVSATGIEYVINGKKWFITNAPYERTKIFIVMGKSDPGQSEPASAAEPGAGAA